MIRVDLHLSLWRDLPSGGFAMELLAKRFRRFRQVLLPLLGLTDWHESIERARPVWARYIPKPMNGNFAG